MRLPRRAVLGDLRADLFPFLLVALLVFAASATTALGPARLRALSDRALRQSLAAAPYDSRSITLQAEFKEGLGDAAAFQTESDHLSHALPPTLQAAFPFSGHSYFARGVTADGPGLAKPSGLPASLTLSDDDRLPRLLNYVQGGSPEAAAAQLPADSVAVSISTETSTALHLPLGAKLRLGDSPDPGIRPVDAVISGVFEGTTETVLSPDAAEVRNGAQDLFRPRRAVVGDTDPRTYWTGVVIVSDAGLARLLSAKVGVAVDATWRQTTEPAAISTARIGALRHDLKSLPRISLQLCDTRYDSARFYGTNCAGMPVVPSSIHTAEGVTPLFDQFSAARLASGALESFGVAGLLAVELAAVFAAARLVAVRKVGSVSLQRARGASLPQCAAALALESALVIAPAALAGHVTGAALGGAGASSPQLWPSLTVALLGIAAVPVIVLRLAVPGRPARVRDVARTGWKAKRRTAEGLVLVLAAAGVLSLRARGTAGTTAAGSIDPQIAAVPVLVGVVAVLVLLKALPRPVAGVARLVTRTRGTAGWLGTARAAERGQTAAVALGVLVVTLSGAVFGGVVVRTLADGQQAAADSIGADAVVTSPDITPPALAALRRAPGVQSVLGELAVPRTAVDDSDGTGHQVILIGVDPGLVPGVPAAPADPLGGGPIPVLGSPSLARDLPGLAFTADMDSITRDFELVATVPGSSDAATLPEILRPAFRGYTGAFVVLPIDELSLLAGGRDATTAVITGNTVTSSALRATLIGKMSPATDIAVRSETLTRLRSDGLARSLTVLFQVCSALSAAFAVLIVVLELAATARERGRTVSFLRTMGLPSRTAGALTVFQLIPTLVAALVAGTALGVALPRLLGPALDLTVFTDGYDAPTRTDVRLTLLLGAALIGVVAVAAAVEAALGRRRRISGVLRLGDE